MKFFFFLRDDTMCHNHWSEHCFLSSRKVINLLEHVGKLKPWQLSLVFLEHKKKVLFYFVC